MINSKQKSWTLSKKSITSWTHCPTSALFPNQQKTIQEKANLKQSLLRKKFPWPYGTVNDKSKKMAKWLLNLKNKLIIKPNVWKTRESPVKERKNKLRKRWTRLFNTVVWLNSKHRQRRKPKWTTNLWKSMVSIWSTTRVAVSSKTLARIKAENPIPMYQKWKSDFLYLNYGFMSNFNFWSLNLTLFILISFYLFKPNAEK